MKRFKSGLIVFGSSLLSALVAVVPTVQFVNFVQWLDAVLVKAGIPSVVLALLAAFISQAWFAWRNAVKLKKERTNLSLSGKAMTVVDLY